MISTTAFLITSNNVHKGGMNKASAKNHARKILLSSPPPWLARPGGKFQLEKTSLLLISIN